MMYQDNMKNSSHIEITKGDYKIIQFRLSLYVIHRERGLLLHATTGAPMKREDLEELLDGYIERGKTRYD